MSPIIFPEPVGPGFTPITLMGTFASQPGQTASGELTFTLTQGMSNANTTLPATPIKVQLDEEGSFSVQLAANDDPETEPQGVLYGVTEIIVGAQPRDYFIKLSREQLTVDISTLMPGEPGWG